MRTIGSEELNHCYKLTIDSMIGYLKSIIIKK